ncbi:CPF_0552 family protein [Marinilabilia sp.]
MSTPNEHIIGIHVDDRYDEAQQVQEILTRYGCSIRTRLGLHHTNGNNCSEVGIILLQLIPDDEKAGVLVSALKKVEGVQIKEMVF